MNKILGYVFTAVLILAIFSGCSTPAEQIISNPQYTISRVSRAMGGESRVSIELAASLPDFPPSLQVYKMVKPVIEEKYVKALSAKFGLTGEFSEGTKNCLISEKETRTYLQVYKSTGTFKYSKYSILYPDNEIVIQKPPVLPSKEEALKIATDFLVERDLLPEGDVAYRVDVGGTTGEIPTHLLVSFQHAVPITGPGARHGLRIGDGGEVVQVFINPTNPLVLPPHAMVTAKSVKQAYREMIADKDYSAPSECRKVIIDNVVVAYWLEAIDKGQDYVVPVYKFTGRCLDNSGQDLDQSFTCIIEALN